MGEVERKAAGGHPIAVEASIAYVGRGEHGHALELHPRFHALVAKFGFPAGSNW